MKPRRDRGPRPFWLTDNARFLDSMRPSDWTAVGSLACPCHPGRDWLRWAQERERRWNATDSGVHASGKQVPHANLIGALGEAAYHVLTRAVAVGWRDDRRGIPGADFQDGVDVKASGRWYNPFLAVPRKQLIAPRFSLVAVALDAEPLIPAVSTAVLWAAERDRVIACALENESYDPVTFVDWHRTGVPHYVVNWAQVLMGTGLTVSEPAPPDPEPEPADPAAGADAVGQMRLIARGWKDA